MTKTKRTPSESTYEMAKTGEPVTTAVAIKETTALALPTELQGSWGTENVEAKDVLIPRIFLAQKMSDVVDTAGVKPGQFYRSTSKEVLGGGTKAIELLILSSFKTWTIEKKKGEKYEFESVIPYTPTDANLPWDFTEQGETKRRNETFSFYVIPVADFQTSEVLPAVLSFRRTQVACAKAITSYMMLMKNYRTPACTYVLDFTSTLKENDFGSFHVPEMKKGRKATIEEMTVCKQWYDAISKGVVKVDAEAVVEA